MAAYRPPYTITPRIVDLVVRIGEALGDKARSSRSASPALRRANRVRTVQASLAIEGNTLTVDQVTAIAAGRRVAGPEREVREIRNAVAAYDRMSRWNPASAADLRAAHAVLMAGLVERPGEYRRRGVGIRRGGRIIHVAPPAERVPALVRDLLGWMKRAGEHPVIAGCVLHYEIEFIHPFEDGNGRLGRLWNSLVLFSWDPVFAALPLESVIRDRHAEYYRALRQADDTGQATPFVELVLAAILEACRALPVSDPVGDPVGDPVDALLAALGRGPTGTAELMAALALKHRASFRRRHLHPALLAGLIEMTLPDTPNSRLQRYRLTAKGRARLRRPRRA
jgi:Fic family protein